MGGRSHIEQLLDGGFIEMKDQAGSDKTMQNIFFSNNSAYFHSFKSNVFGYSKLDIPN